jgi:uncharacterized protein (DUF1499 family)
MINTQWPRGGVLIAALVSIAGCTGGRPPATLGLTEGRLAPCPASPNCVSSQASTDGQRVEALRYSGDSVQARNHLLAVLKEMERVQVERADANFIHAEFRSSLFGFVDDVEFYFDPPGVIQMRSASRLGYSDLGVNRERVEMIRVRFSATRGASS